LNIILDDEEEEASAEKESKEGSFSLTYPVPPPCMFILG
jgi:hypothetical protein